MVAIATFVADTTTPIRAYAALRRASIGDASFFFESSDAGGKPGRYAVLAYRARREITLQASGFWVGSHGLPHGMPPVDSPRDSLDAARFLFPPRQQGSDPRAPFATRFAGAFFGYAAWDLVHHIDRALGASERPGAPLARFFGNATYIVFEEASQTMSIIAEDQAGIEQTQRHLDDVSQPPITPPQRGRFTSDIDSDLDDAGYGDVLRRGYEHVVAGDVRQLVIARRFGVPRGGRDPFDVFRAMRVLDPSPCTYFLDLPPGPGERTRMQIAGASNGTLVRVHDGTATFRAASGSRGRGRSAVDDDAIADALLHDEAARATHMALADVSREDIARVVDPTTVKLVRSLHVDRSARATRLTSEVTGRLLDGASSFDVLRAAFPAAAACGAPKANALKIVRELETAPRSIYGGAIGFMTKDGELDFSIAARVAVCAGERFSAWGGTRLDRSSDLARATHEASGDAQFILSGIASL